MTEKCTLNFVPVAKMAHMLEKYVNSNEAHGLETFFDHEVFRKSYHEVRKSLLDANLLAGGKSYTEIAKDIEDNLRNRVRDFLNFQFQSINDTEDYGMIPSSTTNPLAAVDSQLLEQAKQTY